MYKPFKQFVAVLLVLGIIFTLSSFPSKSAYANTTDTSFLDVSTGRSLSLALRTDGTVWARGMDYRGNVYGGTLDTPGRYVQIKEITDAAAISAGYDFHSVILMKDGTVWASGGNGYGELGIGSYESKFRYVRVPNLTDVSAIDTGSSYTLALKKDGTVWQWGWDFADLTTDGPRNDRTSPELVAGLKDVTAIAAGGRHALALTRNGEVWAWGQNNQGELGNNTRGEQYAPVRVPELDRVVAIAAGNSHSMALQEDGTVWTWGGNGGGQLGNGTFDMEQSPNRINGLKHVVQISARGDQSAALLKDGSVWAWGSPLHKMGDSWYWNEGGYPTPEAGSLHPVRVNELTGVSHISAGVTGLFALNKEYTGYVMQSKLKNDRIVSVSAGGESSFAIDKDSRLWTWGFGGFITMNNEFYVMGSKLDNAWQLSMNQPERNELLTDVKLIAVGSGQFMLAVKKDGTVWGWGNNESGQLGNNPIEWIDDPDTENLYLNVRDEQGEKSNVEFRWKIQMPVQVDGLEKIKDVHAGGAHSVALGEDGTLWTWGDNILGQLGRAASSFEASPGKVPGLTGVIASAAGEEHTIALMQDGSVWAWGRNDDGQLGDGSTTTRNAPVRVKDLDDVIAVHAGRKYSLALKQDGSVWAWGNNEFGQLGNGTTETSSVPVRVQLMDHVVSISTGGSHALAVTQLGELWAWGQNNSHQLGDLSRVDRNKPILVKDIRDVAEVTAGSGHTLILKKDGSVWAWGSNSSGQVSFSYNDTPNVYYPYEVYQLTVDDWHGEFEFIPLSELADESSATYVFNGDSSLADQPDTWAKAEVEKAISLDLVPRHMMNRYTEQITRAEFSTLAIRFVESFSDHTVDEIQVTFIFKLTNQPLPIRRMKRF